MLARVEKRVNWSSAPGAAVSSVFAFVALRRLLTSLLSSREISYIFKQQNADVFLWSSVFYLVLSIGVLYVSVEKTGLSSYSLFTVCTLVFLAELRFEPDPSVRNPVVLLLSPVFLQILISVFQEGTHWEGVSNLLCASVYRLFSGVAVVAYCLLAVGTTAVILSVLFVKTSPLVAMTHDPTPAIAFLIGGEESYYDARIQFWAAAIGAVFVAVVTDATRHREVRWLAALTIIINISTVAFFLRQNFWTATVAAVGALLTVITLALVLDERTEATLS